MELAWQLACYNQESHPFHWSIAQGERSEWFKGLGTASILTWLRSRSWREPDPDRLGQLRRQLSPDEEPDDFWIIGGHVAVETRHGCHDSTVHLAEVVGREGSVVHVNLRSGRGRRREVELPLPDDAVCVRLLRQPFPELPAEPRSPAPHTPTIGPLRTPPFEFPGVFSAVGGKLFARGRSGGLLAFPIPGGPRDLPARPKIHRVNPGARVLAVGRCGKCTAALISNPRSGVASLEVLAGRHGDWRQRSYVLEEGLPDPWRAQTLPLGSLGAAHHGEAGPQLWICAGPVLAHLVLEGSAGKLSVVSDQVRTCKLDGEGQACLGSADGPQWARIHGRAIDTDPLDRVLRLNPGERALLNARFDTDGAAERKVMMGPAGRRGLPGGGVIAFEGNKGEWYVLDRTGVLPFSPPRDTEAVGVLVG